MQWKTTLALLIATIGIGSYISLYELKQPSPEQRERLSKQLLDVQPDTVSQLVLDLPQAKVTLAREGSAWTLAPNRVRADGDLVGRILDLLSPLTAERILSGTPQQPLDLKAFGLDPAVGWLSLVANGTPATLLIGETTPVGSNRYAKLADHPEIAVVPARLFEDANQSSGTFRDPLLIRFDAWSADGLTVASAGGTFSLTRSNNAWRLAQPLSDAAERSDVNVLLSSLSGIRIKRFVNDAPQVEELATWGFEHPKAEVELSRQSVTPPRTTIFFGSPLADDASLVYAKRDDEPAIYAVASADVEALLKDPHGLRARACFEFFTTNVSKVELTREGASWTIEKTEGQWRAAGSDATLDTPRVEQFLSELADLRVSGFMEDAPKDMAPYGLTPPGGVIAVWTTDRSEPQRLLVGSMIEGSTNRYGRIEEREAIVRLPDLVTTLLTTTVNSFSTPSS